MEHASQEPRHRLDQEAGQVRRQALCQLRVWLDIAWLEQARLKAREDRDVAFELPQTACQTYPHQQGRVEPACDLVEATPKRPQLGMGRVEVLALGCAKRRQGLAVHG